MKSLKYSSQMTPSDHSSPSLERGGHCELTNLPVELFDQVLEHLGTQCLSEQTWLLRPGWKVLTRSTNPSKRNEDTKSDAEALRTSRKGEPESLVPRLKAKSGSSRLGDYSSTSVSIRTILRPFITSSTSMLWQQGWRALLLV
jgi:hypothetical protein